MARDQIPIGEADFWWMRYGLGIAAPVALVLWGFYSIISQHSYAAWYTQRRLSFVPVHGGQAILMGIACLGGAMACFAYFYAQYHEKMGWYYEWPTGIGAVIAGGGVLWCGAYFLYS